MIKSLSWLFVFIIGPLLVLWQESSSPTAAPGLPPDVMAAKSQYDAAIAAAAEAFDRTVAQVHADYLASLDLAQRTETKAGNVESAAEIRDARRAAEKAGPNRLGALPKDAK